MSDMDLLRELKADKLRAEIAALEASRRQAESEAVGYELRNQQLEREVKTAAALSSEAHILPFYAPVNGATASHAIQELDIWARRDPGCDITIVFNSPGGSVIDGFALYDFIQELRKAGHNVTTKAFGMAASMGGILLQAGDQRVMSANASMLIHEISSMTVGKMSEIEDHQAFTRMLWDRGAKILASRANLTERQVKSKANRKDWWFGAEDALEMGFIDRIETGVEASV